jgi:NADH-quinone oxidoreductase subunit L
LLIGFWFENVKNAEAGRKAFVANRIGDVGFALGIMLIFATFGTLTFKEVFEIAETNKAITTLIFTLITLLLFVGATGKSAQIPLFVWLPDAMAGPTPVSALIHAATMVTAGIYMMTRAHVLFEHAPFTQHTVATIGALTAFVAGYAAITQWDIKKVLAYSTVSQLGFMVAAAGLGAYVASHFHLLTHAFFKALLFLGAGSVIHGMEHFAHVTHDPSQRLSDPQDMRNMGALRKKMPITFVTFVIGGLALAGVPPFAGFWSKDEIVTAALHHNFFVFVLLTFTAFFTAFYVGRQLLLVFWGRARTEDASYAQESAPTMTIALIVLAFFAVIAGLINLPANFPMAGWLAHWLEPMLGAHESEPMNFVLAGAFTVLSIGALALAALVYRRKYHWATQPDPLERFGALYTLSRRKWYFDEAYRTFFVIPFYAASSFLARVFDLGGIDAIVNGVGEFVRDSANGLRRVQNGFVRSYGLVMLLGVAAILAYLLLAAR